MQVFSKRLTKTDVDNRLSVNSSRALQHLPGFGGGQRALPLTVEDEEGKRWVFRFRIRQGKYKKPEFSNGWLDFVRSKKLKIGDEIRFFKEEDEATGVVRYRIEVMIETRVFGAIIGYVPYHQVDR